MNNTNLPPHGIHVIVNNQYRSETESAYSFRFPPSVSFPANVGSYLMQLKKVTTHHFVPNIRRGLNDILSVEVDGVVTDLVIGEDNYNIDSLVTLINTFLASLKVGLAFVYDYDFYKLTLSVPAATTFKFVSPQRLLNTQFRADYQSPYDFLLAMLGYEDVANVLYAGATFIEASRAVNLIPASALYIYVNQDLQVISSDPANPQVIATVALDVPYGSIITYEPQQPRTYQVTPQNILNMLFQVIDNYGNPINVPKNVGLQMEFTLLPQTRIY
jgi:hypothetical protein